MSWTTISLCIFITTSCILVLLSISLADLRRNRPSTGLVIALLFSLEYALRPLYILDRGEIGWDPGTFAPMTPDDPSFSFALITSTAAIALFTATFGLFRLLAQDVSPTGHARPINHITSWRNARSWTLLTGLILTVSALIARQASGDGSAFSGSFGRQNFTSGYTYLLVNIPMTAILAGLVVAHYRGERVWDKKPRRLAALGLPFVAIHALWTGGRNDSIAFLLGISMIALLQAPRIKLRYLVAVTAVAVLTLASYRISTREVLYSGELKQISLVSEITEDPLGVVVRGDISSFDKIYVLRQARSSNNGASTYFSALTILLPGFEKSDGGNQVLTRIADPDRYERGRTFEGSSYFGEAFLSFGLFGVALSAIGLAICSSAVDRWARRESLSSLFIWALYQGSIPSLLRSDAENYVAAFAPHLLFGAGLLLFVQKRANRMAPADPVAKVELDIAMANMTARAGAR